MKKKDARILWNEEEGKITDFRIVEYTKQNMEKQKELYRIYRKDFGNCNMVWEDYIFVDVLLYFFVKHEFASHELKIKFLDQLTQIEEFREDMVNWIDQMPSYDNGLF